MAFIAISPVTANPTININAAQRFSLGVIKDLTGTAVDISAWTSLQAKLAAPAATPNTADVTFGTVTGDSSGNLTLQTSASDLNGKTPGSARLVVTGKPTSGDDAQLMASGVCTVLQS